MVLPEIRAQIELLASLPPVDDDGDWPRGLFIVTDERGNAESWESAWRGGSEPF
ncbi:MAG TPA: hypothetical protein VE198_12750 [Actinoallomurus sp.]|jgi:hypothetical protein|nr:hypothetical protein [Actinoallomurus sp.]